MKRAQPSAWPLILLNGFILLAVSAGVVFPYLKATFSVETRAKQPLAPVPMVWIPGGTLVVDDEGCGRRDVVVESFWMDGSPITSAQFERFVRETGYPAEKGLPPTPRDVAAYARWAGKRMPTGEEIEWAARSGALRGQARSIGLRCVRSVR